MTFIHTNKPVAIYVLLDKDGFPIYVGKSINPKTRAGEHKIQKPWISCMLILEWTIHSLTGAREGRWISYFRALGFPLENKNNGGGGSNGFTEEQKLHVRKAMSSPEVKTKLKARRRPKWTEERRKKQSESMRGRKPWSTGFTKQNHPSLAKLSINMKQSENRFINASMAGQGNKGKKKSPEHVAKMIKMNTGRKFSKETREKQSKARYNYLAKQRELKNGSQ